MIHFGPKYLVNNEELLACIYMLQGHEFIPTRHYGVKYIGGQGEEDRFSHRKSES